MMPHLFPFANPAADDDAHKMEYKSPNEQPRRPSLLQNIGGLLKTHQDRPAIEPQSEVSVALPSSVPEVSAGYRKRIPSLSRPPPVYRQDSEKREKLQEVPPSPTEKSAASTDRRRASLLSVSNREPAQSPRYRPIPSLSAREDACRDDIVHSEFAQTPTVDSTEAPSRSCPAQLPPLQIPDVHNNESEFEVADEECEVDRTSLQEEYDRRWILNLSMFFRDTPGKREKFFVTYAETSGRWRRLTISVDYRNAPEGSLEADLSTLHYQRDKSLRIHEAIRESLSEIQFYNTVTNLKLETTPEDGQLHVHVREDANEIISFPSVSLFQHIQCRMLPESDLDLISHISGFVYKVRASGELLIKKEIPGPHTVDEFMYEVNALDSLLGSPNVVQLRGLVTDDSGAVVKGLLIAYAAQGALVDMIYDFRGTSEFPWSRREKWAKQIVEGLSRVHEAGFVQGDFTLSNIVIDEADNAQIIDINRRGCPVGWESPELTRLIESGQRISMCIGVKTDLFQLGMVLWALAEEADEPERVARPLPPLSGSVPDYFRKVVETCLSPRPQGRLAAKRLLRSFPAIVGLSPAGRPAVEFEQRHDFSDNSVSTSHRSDKEYIDPKLSITLDEVRRRRDTDASGFTSGQVTYVDPESNPASSYRFESSGSWIIGNRRGRSPVSSRNRRNSPFGRTASSTTSLSDSRSPPSGLQRAGSRESDFCASLREKSTGPTTSTTEYPPSLPRSELRLPPSLGKYSHSKPEIEQLQPPPPIQTKRLGELHNKPSSQLLHTDSGFDEHMVGELDWIDDRSFPKPPYSQKDAYGIIPPATESPPAIPDYALDPTKPRTNT
ncbi:Hypothetical protein R9X50_00236200 [Acrodontium crateriforme]|uniref:Protein kinase domain-containing protein n=1 Tax=Acrodontium crateriforme TaxID=150365 RepID=A0AAQ3M448_9PEZI|nr:Hypothetical protein R9X50_00236200 [Acrodontium crateriforme]